MKLYRNPKSAPVGLSSVQMSDQAYRDANGLILMCMYCHRARRNLPDSDQWEWVEAYATATPTRTSHGICKNCLNAALSGAEHIKARG